MKHGTKVLRKEMDGTFSSCTAASPLSYAKGAVTRRRRGEGPLAVFTNRGYAEMFMRENFHRERNLFVALNCEYEESKHSSLWLRMDCPDFLRIKRNSLPGGTAFANAVRILDEEQ